MEKNQNRSKLLVAAVTSVSLMFAAGGCGPEDETGSDRATLQERQKRMSKRLDRVLDRINATQEQRRRIHSIKANLINQAAPLRKERRQLAKKALSEWNSKTPDRRGLHRAVDRQLELIKAFAHLAVDRAVEVHSILSPSQRTQLVELVKQVRRMHRMWHGH